ncbi:hypothetical protein BAUCODRAFT_109037 [Baudoinia panamericana UAMH 10762]|uniref:Cytochrome P450 n=1 Tax=Baudoinia panamericana (strain UAMH 10762) TaxID=717646 RepID=M2N945_BAUPA|nr:uncharacterized protein BAUCODRAFT_109037 [Baudoinia panamericana UAMH 10762]EMC95609.1 hypothetical protein BAUCODRAFT_109037 [Baudoinia panamericana UAMH 10762]
MTSFLEYLSHPLFIASCLLVGVVVLWAATSVPSPVPSNLPWQGMKEQEFLGHFRASLRSFGSMREWLKDGYERYSKNGKSYIIPDVSGRTEVIIPPQKLRWLLDHPDSVSSVGAAHYDQLVGDYNFTDPYVLGTLYHEHVVHKSLARNMANIIPNIQDEVQHALDETWGKDTADWKDICVFSNMMEVVAQLSNRMFVGLPLCRNKDYGRLMGGFANSVISAVTLMPLFPAFIRPIVGPVITIPNQYYWWRVSKYTVPLIKEREANMARRKQDPSFKWEEPNDYITWHINVAEAEGRKKDLDPVMIARFLLPLNFAAIHTTVFTITNVFFDLLGSDPKDGFLEGLREEAENVWAESKGNWSKQSLAKLYRADSAIRESMRVSNFMTHGLLRKVIGKDGITDPEEGFKVPYGGYVATDVHSVQHDPDIYPDPERYDAFRFSRPIEEFEAKRTASGGALDPADEKEWLRLKQTGIVATGETFLPFGHGKHACPGRFFVSHELKMLLAYVVMNYDVQYLGKRPENQWFGQSVIPPTTATIKVKRRSQAAAV